MLLLLLGGVYRRRCRCHWARAAQLLLLLLLLLLLRHTSCILCSLLRLLPVKVIESLLEILEDSRARSLHRVDGRDGELLQLHKHTIVLLALPLHKFIERIQASSAHIVESRLAHGEAETSQMLQL